MENKFCKYCGAEISSGSNFCKKCGRAINSRQVMNVETNRINTMRCPHCGSENVNVQVVSNTQTKRKGCLYWILIGWWLELFLWVFLTIPMLFAKLFGSKGKVKTEIESYAVCQKCGHKWKIYR